MNLTAELVELFSNGKCNCTANAAADYANLFKTVGVCGNAEWTYEVVNAVALFKVIQPFGSCADNLEDDSYCSCLSVIACNGKRNTLAVLVNTENDKMTRLCLFCDKRSVNLHQCNSGVKNFFLNYFVHFLISFHLILKIHNKTF